MWPFPLPSFVSPEALAAACHLLEVDVEAARNVYKLFFHFLQYSQKSYSLLSSLASQKSSENPSIHQHLFSTLFPHASSENPSSPSSPIPSLIITPAALTTPSQLSPLSFENPVTVTPASPVFSFAFSSTSAREIHTPSHTQNTPPENSLKLQSTEDFEILCLSIKVLESTEFANRKELQNEYLAFLEFLEVLNFFRSVSPSLYKENRAVKLENKDSSRSLAPSQSGKHLATGCGTSASDMVAEGVFFFRSRLL
jgi:hypothetical protein